MSSHKAIEVGDASAWQVNIRHFSLRPSPLQASVTNLRSVHSSSPSNFFFWLSSHFSDHSGGLKRRGPASKKEPRKRRKVDEAPSEDLLVAMALSRSEMEPCAAVPVLRLESAFSERIKPEAGLCDQNSGPGRVALGETTSGSRGSGPTPPLMVSLLFLSREEKSQEETPSVSPIVVSPGL